MACATFAAGVLGFGCASSGDAAPGRSSEPGLGGSVGAGGSGANLGGSGGSGGSAKPPEQEIEGSFLVPVVTGKFVWSANPTSGRVALIDAETLAVRVFNAGFGPKYLAALPGEAGAIVINELSRDATLFRMDGAGEVSAHPGKLPIHEDANAWTISATGDFAIAWSDASTLPTTDATQGFQDVSVVRLTPGEESVTRLSIGFRPTELVIDAAGTRAFAVTEDGISVIELGPSPQVSALYPVSDDPLEDPVTRDVDITPDGDLAIVRIEGSAELGLIDLESGARSTIAMPGSITDLDLAADGSRAFAVIGESSQIVVVPLPPDDDPTSFPQVAIDGESVASVALSPGGEVALLYENGVPNSHLTVLDTRPDEAFLAYRTFDVKGPVQAVFPAPDAQTAIVFQAPPAGSTKAGVFSVVPSLSQRAAKIVGVDAAPTAVAFAPDGRYALVTTGDATSTSRGVYRVKLENLQEDFVELASPPLEGATGVVSAAGRGFVAQAHPEGRITFIDLETGAAHTLTGFELAAKISYGSGE